jgi:uridylate kinase
MKQNSAQKEVPWTIISLGGSLIAPSGIDTRFLLRFRALILKLLAEGKRFVIIAGGGQTCRTYQDAARAFGDVPADDLDWVGIQATRLNAQLVRTLFHKEAAMKIIFHPEDDELPRDARLIIGAGWKPGFSSDYDAAVLAKRLGAWRIVNLSNTKFVHAEDPKKNAKAARFERMAWSHYLEVIGDHWVPGRNSPFDPVAAKLCEKEKLSAIIVSGEDLKNVEKALRGEKFEGTVIC